MEASTPQAPDFGVTSEQNVKVQMDDVVHPRGLAVGMPVRLRGLKSSWYLNGCVGRVIVDTEPVANKIGVLISSIAGWRQVRVAFDCAEALSEEEALDCYGAEKLIEETFRRNEAAVIQSASCKQPG